MISPTTDHTMDTELAGKDAAPKPSMKVRRRGGGFDLYYGQITIGGEIYPMQPWTGLSRLFFRVTDTMHRSIEYPNNVFFYENPETYFACAFPTPRHTAENNDGTTYVRDEYAWEFEQWTARRNLFTETHSGFYQQRDDILCNPAKYV